MYRIKLRGTDCMQDPKYIQKILAAYEVDIIRSYNFFGMVYIVDVDANNLSELLYDLNENTHYGVRLVCKKKLKGEK